MRRLSRLLAGAMLALAAVAAAHPPVVQPPATFATGLDGPEGLAFANDGALIVGSAGGEVRRVAPDGTHTLLADVGDRLAGITVLRDGRILACGFDQGRVWSIDPATGFATVYAAVRAPNFVVQTKRGRVLVRSSFDGTINEITGGANVVVASGLSFPNGLALRKKYLYVAETGAGRVSRLPFTVTPGLGAPEVYASGFVLPDGIAFDRPGNLYVVGADVLSIVDVKTLGAPALPSDPLFDWPSNLAFGRTNAYGKGTLYLVNFGPLLGNGTTVVRMATNHRGAKLVR